MADRIGVAIAIIGISIIMTVWGYNEYHDYQVTCKMQEIERAGAEVKYGRKPRSFWITISEGDVDRFEDRSWPATRVVDDLSKLTHLERYANGVHVLVRRAPGNERSYCSIREGQRHYARDIQRDAKHED